MRTEQSMKRALPALLKIRTHREEQERRRVCRYRARLEAGQRQLQERRQALDEYRAWRPQHEAERFAALQNQPVSLRVLADYRATLEALRAQEKALGSQMQEAAAAVAEAQAVLARAEAALRTATKSKEKLMELLAKTTAPAEMDGSEASD